jgi:hypothetical protein
MNNTNNSKIKNSFIFRKITLYYWIGTALLINRYTKNWKMFTSCWTIVYSKNNEKITTSLVFYLHWTIKMLFLKDTLPLNFSNTASLKYPYSWIASKNTPIYKDCYTNIEETLHLYKDTNTLSVYQIVLLHGYFNTLVLDNLNFLIMCHELLR